MAHLVSTPAEELHTVIAGIRQHMIDSFADDEIEAAQAAEKRLTKLEAMTPEEFANRYADPPLDSE